MTPSYSDLIFTWDQPESVLLGTNKSTVPEDCPALIWTGAVTMMLLLR